MRISYQIAFAVLIGLGALYAGVANFYSPAYVIEKFAGIDISSFTKETRVAVEVQVRLLAGMWVAVGIFAFVIIPNFERHTNVVRTILLGMALGSVGELITKVVLDGDVSAALIKCSAQISIYLAMELWRGYLVSKRA